MFRMPIDSVCAMFRCFGGYDTGAPARQLRVPVRCINGDRFPTDVEAIRRVIADFDAVVLPHTGHFPMLECPEEFNRRLGEIVLGLGIVERPQPKLAPLMLEYQASTVPVAFGCADEFWTRGDGGTPTASDP